LPKHFLIVTFELTRNYSPLQNGEKWEVGLGIWDLGLRIGDRDLGLGISGKRLLKRRKDQEEAVSID